MNSLPVEIVSIILSYACDSNNGGNGDGGGDYRAYVSVRAVCRSWRSTVVIPRLVSACAVVCPDLCALLQELRVLALHVHAHDFAIYSSASKTKVEFSWNPQYYPYAQFYFTCDGLRALIAAGDFSRCEFAIAADGTFNNIMPVGFLYVDTLRALCACVNRHRIALSMPIYEQFHKMCGGLCHVPMFRGSPAIRWHRSNDKMSLE